MKSQEHLNAVGEITELIYIANQMKNHYFTFGIGQVNAGCYIIIRADDPDTAREEMIHRFGNKWSFQYSEEEWHEDGKPLNEIYHWKLLK